MSRGRSASTGRPRRVAAVVAQQKSRANLADQKRSERIHDTPPIPVRAPVAHAVEVSPASEPSQRWTKATIAARAASTDSDLGAPSNASACCPVKWCAPAVPSPPEGSESEGSSAATTESEGSEVGIDEEVLDAEAETLMGDPPLSPPFDLTFSNTVTDLAFWCAHIGAWAPPYGLTHSDVLMVQMLIESGQSVPQAAEPRGIRKMTRQAMGDWLREDATEAEALNALWRDQVGEAKLASRAQALEADVERPAVWHSAFALVFSSLGACARLFRSPIGMLIIWSLLAPSGIYADAAPSLGHPQLSEAVASRSAAYVLRPRYVSSSPREGADHDMLEAPYVASMGADVSVEPRETTPLGAAAKYLNEPGHLPLAVPSHDVASVDPAVSRRPQRLPPMAPFPHTPGRPLPRCGQTRTDHLGRDGPVSGRTTGWEDALIQDASALAILPGRPEELAGILEEMRELLDMAYAQSTNKTDQSHLKAWKEACDELGTPCWRTDVAANMGFDPVGYRRELLLPALAFLRMYPKMRARARADRGKGANPRSCLLKLYAVAREHKKRGYQMAPLTIAMKVMAGMLHKYVLDNGTDSLIPARKNPLTNKMIDQMVALPDGAAAEGFSMRMRRSEYFWQAVIATIVVLSETGMRKSDVSKPLKSTPFTKGRLTLGSVRWRIGGVLVAAPTEAQLDTLGQSSSDGCWLVYGAMKNDAYGEHFGSKPSWLPYHPTDARNACREIASLESHARSSGIFEGQRSHTPLFGPRVGTEWHHSLLEGIFEYLLAAACGLDKAARHAFSLHSFRIYLACALYAAGCPNDRIMAILRWRSEEALAIYARLNDDERSAWIAKGRCQVVNSTATAHLPRIDPDDYVAAIHASMGSGELSRVAAIADAGDLDPDEVDTRARGLEPNAQTPRLVRARSLGPEEVGSLTTQPVLATPLAHASGAAPVAPRSVADGDTSVEDDGEAAQPAMV